MSNKPQILPTAAGGTGISSTATFPASGTVAVTTDIPSVATYFSVVGRQVFTANGTYTPTAGTKYCDVEILSGGGGGGGAAASATGSSCGGGGGAGGYVRKVFPVATITGQSVTVGGGGAGGTAGANAGTGGSASLIGVILGSTPGAGGAGGTNVSATGFGTTLGGAGGTGVGQGGDFGFVAQSGGNSTLFLTYFVAGKGGNSIYGNGGRVNSVTPVGTGDAGAAGSLYGSGGSGGIDCGSNTARAGGAGSAGIVIITEYR